MTGVMEPVRDRRIGATYYLRYGASGDEEVSNGHFGISTRTRYPRRFLLEGDEQDKFEMHHYRQAPCGCVRGFRPWIWPRAAHMGWRTAAALTLASEQGWLDSQQPLPEDATIADALAPPKRASTTISHLEPLREQIAAWHAQGVSGVVILAALKREHGYTGSYSAVRRLLATLKRETPPDTTIRLDFAPGEAAQVDFGAGPMSADAAGVVRRTWAFVMTLCFGGTSTSSSSPTSGRWRPGWAVIDASLRVVLWRAVPGHHRQRLC